MKYRNKIVHILHSAMGKRVTVKAEIFKSLLVYVWLCLAALVAVYVLVFNNTNVNSK
jgi:hypothetical protein